MTKEYERKKLYVLRRACWLGRARNSDLIERFEVTSATASKVLQEAINEWPHVLYQYRKSGVFKKEEAVTPKEASAETMIELFEKHAGPEDTGLTHEEASVFFVQYPPRNRPLSGLDIILEYVFKARQAYINPKDMRGQHIVIEILYVGLKKNDLPRWRKVVCNGLQHNGQVWRLLAQDINSPGYIQKHYVMSRIMDARPSPTSVPKDFEFKDVKAEKTKVEVIFNEELNNEQRQVLSNELGVKDGRITVPKNELFYFKRYYQDDKKNMGHVVWPLITYSKEV
ncbi:hypothetical protein Dthio_PD1743 [Desulfonatronospira thiodismutans ASO3-1]|uniref:WYL domain-containing protein n=1 Tax=Desulfonatronospira thiodismutans ASO3-1 TaxID=555779 RepID=D6SNR4_9BACT|nr:hypothetical protein [Desulfonatronospira thiodismutans]EFI34390.1 hypothetical protein Dthio_PD1743 [Desulfonatronospira thiodismutans ASO3-1]